MMSSHTLWISSAIYKQMIDEAEKLAPHETGGVFMGYRAENDDIVVTDLIDSGEGAKHKYYKFSPDQDYQLRKIADIYKKSGGTITYIGDWHTHPNSDPELSWIDKRTLTKIALTKESQNTHPIMMVLGGKPEKWTLNSVQFISGEFQIWPFFRCKYNRVSCEIYSE